MSAVYTIEQNEYIFLHAVLDSPFVWGVRADFEDAAAEQAAMDAAYESLQNKGYVKREADHLYITPDLWELLKVCVAPQQVLMFSYANAQGEQDLRFIYVSEDKLVDDRVLPSTARQLQPVGDVLDLAAILRSQARLDEQTQASGEAQTLSTAMLESLSQIAAEQGKAAVVEALTQSGMDGDSANSLAQAYVEPLANTVLTRIIPDEGDGVTTSMSFVESAEGLWELHSLDEGQMQLIPVDALTAWQMIAGFCGAEINDGEGDEL